MSPSDRVFELTYQELRQLAAQVLGPGGGRATLQPTAVVHEAWLRLSDRDGAFTGRDHFLATAAMAMRQILVDAARRRRADKRGGRAERLTLAGDLLAAVQAEVDVIDLHDALERLARAYPRPARLVELRFFGGLSVPEAARVLEVSEATATTDWRFARAWLNDALGEPHGK